MLSGWVKEECFVANKNSGITTSFFLHQSAFNQQQLDRISDLNWLPTNVHQLSSMLSHSRYTNPQTKDEISVEIHIPIINNY